MFYPSLLANQTRGESRRAHHLDEAGAGACSGARVRRRSKRRWEAKRNVKVPNISTDWKRIFRIRNFASTCSKHRHNAHTNARCCPSVCAATHTLTHAHHLEIRLIRSVNATHKNRTEAAQSLNMLAARQAATSTPASPLHGTVSPLITIWPLVVSGGAAAAADGDGTAAVSTLGLLSEEAPQPIQQFAAQEESSRGVHCTAAACYRSSWHLPACCLRGDSRRPSCWVVHIVRPQNQAREYQTVTSSYASLPGPARIWPDLLDCKTEAWLGFCNS